MLAMSRCANALHVKTRPGVIERALLFPPGATAPGPHARRRAVRSTLRALPSKTTSETIATSSAVPGFFALGLMATVQVGRVAPGLGCNRGLEDAADRLLAACASVAGHADDGSAHRTRLGAKVCYNPPQDTQWLLHVALRTTFWATPIRQSQCRSAATTVCAATRCATGTAAGAHCSHGRSAPIPICSRGGCTALAVPPSLTSAFRLSIAAQLGH